MAPDSRGTLLVVAVLVGVIAGGALALAVLGAGAPGPSTGAGTATDGDVASLSQFENASAFQQYLARADARGAYQTRFQGAADVPTGSDGGDAGAPRPDRVETDAPARATQAATETAVETELQTSAPADDTASGEQADRVAETNVQVTGLDEPDVVKTDGSHFYYAPDRRHRHVREPQPDVVRSTQPRRRPSPDTLVIDVEEPADPAAIADIADTGRLLRTGDHLLVLGDERLTAYDVTDPADPTEAWTRPLEDPIVTAREANGTVYLVTRSRVRAGTPCPLEPLGGDAPVPCEEIYRPDAQIAADTTYTAFAIDAAAGEVRDWVSFVGTGDTAAVYTSHNGLYVTYTQRTDRSALLADFLTEDFDRTPDRVERRIADLRSYDISPDSQRREVRRAVETWLDGLADTERREVRDELSDGFQSYLGDRQRDLERTGIVRVTVDDAALSIAATGEVPGEPLDQFSLSEHEGTLRVATTVGNAGDAASQNDLYVLDAGSLDELGRVTGMGEGQRVYAVRYVDDTAYVVTFRQVDPLHVIDLSEPTDPVERGTLELPGFSTYLHPIDDDHVLGIGEEDGTVKTVLFDVSDPTDPTVADDRLFDARWSAVADSHHAFTIDRRHEVFFLPAGDAGHLVAYTNGTLSRAHTVETTMPAQRARYVGDHLYVFAGTEIAVVDQTTWERETTLALAAGD